MGYDIARLVNDVRSICYGQLYKPIRPEAYECLDRFWEVLKRYSKREPSDNEIRDSVDEMFKSLIHGR